MKRAIVSVVRLTESPEKGFAGSDPMQVPSALALLNPRNYGEALYTQSIRVLSMMISA